MDKAALRQILDRHAPELRALGVDSLYLFGSMARGEPHPGSDIDFFMDSPPDRRFSIFDLVGVKLFLEDITGRNVDLIMRDGLHPLLKDRILAEAEQVI
jgi:hypothetical protein